MTAMVLKSTFLSLNGVDRSSWCSKVELKKEVDPKEVTTFASAGWVEFIGGLFKAGLSITFRNDVTDNTLDETMDALLGTVVAFEVRPTSATVGAGNPKNTGNVLITEWTPIAGSVGEVNEASYTYPTSGVVVRAVA
jgi:hypothetical protein